MSSFTKDELRLVLVNHGVDLPNTSAKKEELVALYEEFVAPQDKGEFSSDDEASSPKKKTPSRSSRRSIGSASKKSKAKEPLTEANSLVVDDLDIAELTDDELFEKLKEHGVDVGPIVDSTRILYQKKLAILIRGENGVENGHDKSIPNGDEFSADDEEVDQPDVVTRKSTRTRTPKTSSPKKVAQISPSGGNLRQRFKDTLSAATTPKETSRFTPTPRRSIHSYKVVETTKETLTTSSDGVVTRDFEYKKTTSGGSVVKAGFIKTLRILPYFFLLLIVAAVGYYVYTNHFIPSGGIVIEEAVDKAMPPEVVSPPPEVEAPPEPQVDQPAVADI